MDIAMKELLIPWIAGAEVFLMLFLWYYCFLHKSLDSACFVSFTALLLCVSLIGAYIITSWRYDIEVSARENTFKYMASMDATDWSLNNEHAKIFKVDGKTFLMLDGGKYEIETTPTRDFFVRTMKGEIVYAVSNKGEIIKF